MRRNLREELIRAGLVAISLALYVATVWIAYRVSLSW